MQSFDDVPEPKEADLGKWRGDLHRQGGIRFCKILLPCIVAAAAVPIRLSGIGTGFAFVMFVARVETLALGHGACALSVRRVKHGSGAIL